MKYTLFFSLLLVLFFQPINVNGQLNKKIIGKWSLVKHIGMPNNLVKKASRTFTFNADDSTFTIYRKDYGIVAKGKCDIKGDSLFPKINVLLLFQVKTNFTEYRFWAAVNIFRK